MNTKPAPATEPEIKTSIRVDFSAPHFDPHTEQIKFSAHVIGAKGSAAFDYSGGIHAFSSPEARAGLLNRYKASRWNNYDLILQKINAHQVKASKNTERPDVMKVFRDLAALSKPEPHNLIACLIMDTNGTDQTFEQWAEDLGYDTDSREAERTYNACRETARKLAAILSPEQRAEAEEIAANY